MRNLRFLCTAAALGSLMLFPQTSAAAPLGSALAAAGQAAPVIADGLVQKVHGWHCYKRRGWYHGHRVWHRHYRACHRKHYYYDDDYDDDYYDYGYYRRPYHSYPYYYSGPFIGFSFGGGRHGWDWDD